MIKPVTFQGQSNFNANLYALEVKSRFIDQNNAHGYYLNYGDELAASVVGGNQIQVGTGAFVVCARMAEITAPEILRPQIFDTFKGYVVARIETYHPADELNVTLIAKVQTSWEALNRELEQNDVYAAEADNVNTANRQFNAIDKTRLRLCHNEGNRRQCACNGAKRRYDGKCGGRYVERRTHQSGGGSYHRERRKRKVR